VSSPDQVRGRSGLRVIFSGYIYKQIFTASTYIIGVELENFSELKKIRAVYIREKRKYTALCSCFYYYIVVIGFVLNTLCHIAPGFPHDPGANASAY